MSLSAVGKLRVSSNRDDLDITMIHRFLAQQSTWARGIPRVTLVRAIDHSLCFGGYIGNAQVAFARVITDFSTFANLVDVFVLPEYRGQGHAKKLIQTIMATKDLQSLLRFTLATANAHGLYSGFGFTAPSEPETLMERYFPNIYDTPDA
jgi:GNAT superfamily N-acetyltransferase